MELLDRRAFLVKVGAGTALAGLSTAGLSVAAFADSQLEFEAQGEITAIIIAGFVAASGPTGLSVLVRFPAGQSSRGRLKIFLDQGGSLVADIPFDVTRAIKTDSPNTLELAGTVIAPVVSPFTDLVGRAIAISAGFTPGAPAEFDSVTVTVAGSHTVIAASAAGTLG
jgi:hypothetical protein